MIREGSDMIIRKAEEKDTDDVLRLLSQVLELHAAIRPDIFIPGTTKYSREELAVIFADENRPVYVAADGEDRVLGYAFCVLREPPRHVNMVPFRTLYIDDLCVDEAVRGAHVGAALFEHVKKEALRLGCYEVTLNVWGGTKALWPFTKKWACVPSRIRWS